MPKIAVSVLRTEDRIRIELEYTDYKEWERILGESAEEHTTLVDSEDPDSGWWKTLGIIPYTQGRGRLNRWVAPSQQRHSEPE